MVIDEMQDYSYLQYVILELLFSCNMTILGDRAQTMDEKPKDVLRFLPGIFGKNIRHIEMNKSYRNTTEIADYAEKIAEVTGIEYIQRHGKEVVESVYPTREEALEEVLHRVNVESHGRDEEEVHEEADAVEVDDMQSEAALPNRYETAAVLTMTEEEAQKAYMYLKDRREEVFYVDRDSSRFRKGITVTTFYLAKGLEFDQVFVLGGDKKSALFRQFRYICATRALHELYVYDLT